MLNFTHSVHMADYLFKLLFVFDIILGNVLISQLPLTWAFCLVSDSCAREGLVSAGFRVGSTGFRWFRVILADFRPRGAFPLFEVGGGGGGGGLGPCLEYGGNIWGKETKQNGKI